MIFSYYYSGSYIEFDNLRKNFFESFPIQVNVNKFIRAHENMFNHSLTEGLKTLVPARSTLSDKNVGFGITIKQNLLEISIRSVSFNVISILTGTGYVTKDFDQWGNFPLIFFLILMFIGGCAGSTACGIKIFRIQLLYHFLSNQLKKNNLS